MNKKEDALTGAATSARAETATMEGAVSIVDFSIIDPARQQGSIEKHLHENGCFGAEKAIAREELVQTLGYSSVRQFRLDVAEERKRGGLILSTTVNHGGYYLPSQNAEQARSELAAFVRSCHSRARKVERIASPARRALAIADGQLVLHNDGGEDN